MVTNHLRAPYGVYFTKNRTILRRPYGARPAAGRIVRFLIIFLDSVRCPVNFRYYLKFHGARTAFGRVIKGKITSAGHRTVPRRRPAGVCTHQTGTGRFLFIIRRLSNLPVICKSLKSYDVSFICDRGMTQKVFKLMILNFIGRYILLSRSAVHKNHNSRHHSFHVIALC